MEDLAVRSQSTTMVPEVYKSKVAVKTQVADNGKSEKSDKPEHVWNRVRPRRISESESQVPKSYKPTENRDAQMSNSNASTIASGQTSTIMENQARFGLVGAFGHKFESCIGTPSKLKGGVVEELMKNKD
ncbi:hypothetical protein N0V90_001616 [Kalmusia sp. IMI 367209]|nr:hypothetical protein N0V90_001616 [Kalmusia sp. IMI 367209]